MHPLVSRVAFVLLLGVGAAARAGDLFSAAPLAMSPAAVDLTDTGDLFDVGRWTMQTYVATIVGDEDHGTMHTAHLGFGYFLADNLSINLEFFGGRADTGPVSGDDDGIVGGFDLLFRWHFYETGRWSFFIDGGAGFQLADTDFPSDSHHNFRPQFGVGLTYALSDNLHLLGGVRYLHISNARTTEGNDGLDGAMLFAGAMWGF